MRYTYLSWRDQVRLDPTGRARAAVTRRFTDSDNERFGEPSNIISKDWQTIVDEFNQQFLRNCPTKFSEILEYDLEMFEKVGPQGGAYSIDKLLANLKQSYDQADIALAGGVNRSDDVLMVGVRTLVRLIKQERELTSTNPQVEYNWVRKDTSGGLPTMGRKNCLLPHVVGASAWMHPWPDVPNARRMRGKDRITHEDATVNVDYVMPYLDACRNWLKEHFPKYFLAWKSPRKGLHRSLGYAVLRDYWFLETDYRSMDLYVSWPVIESYVLPVYEALLSEGEYWHFAAFVRELFQQPVYMGPYLIEGDHNLFSGQSITNDFETIFDLVLYLGAHVCTTKSIEDFNFAGIGDDVVYWAKSELQVRAVYDLVRASTEAVMIPLSLEKTRIQQSTCRFCRMTYARWNRRYTDDDGYEALLPAYPLSLVLLNFVYPEHLLCPTLELASCMARFDNAVGHPLYKQFLQFAFARIKLRKDIPEWAWTEVQARDWWVIVYGTQRPGDSPSINAWRNYLLTLKPEQE